MAEKAQQVRYTGGSGARSITVADWNAVNVKDREGLDAVTWDASNDFTVPREALGFLTDQEFELYIVRDGFFVVEDV
jgi:hypothetical protein